MRGSKDERMGKFMVWAALAGLVLGTAGVSGCGSSQDGDAPAPVASDVAKKSMDASGSYYTQKHAAKK